MTTEIAVHRSEPLVWTFLFPGAEWYCIACGATFGMFSVVSFPLTPELEARREANAVAFREVAVDLITGGMRRKDCDLCTAGSDHATHATDDQWAADGRARRRLVEMQTGHAA